MQQPRVAVVGATGAVGSRVVQILEERNFPLRDLRLLATARSAGAQVRFRGQTLTVEPTTPDAFRGADLCFLAVPGASTSRTLAPQAREAGAVVIDKGSAFRMDPDVPLIVPEVNPEAARGHRGLIATPNCSTIQLVVALHPLQQAARLRRVIVSTYQAASGAGQAGADELIAQAQNPEAHPPRVFPRQLAFNVIPHCDSFEPESGFTQEELKLRRESRKILGVADLRLSATAARVPVVTGHCESVYVETERPLSLTEALAVFAAAPGVTLMDDRAAPRYPTALDAAGRDDVLVGRVRVDPDEPCGLHFWVAADNLRKGAATNGVQIAELLVREGLLG
ncbi:MAG TPA: aspartate-semialdehyde dehydrogenase [Bacillota bacterium]|nr:aspartate-semialdehyde dehydrogenase [Bacillota bacterium]